VTECCILTALSPKEFLTILCTDLARLEEQFFHLGVLVPLHGKSSSIDFGLRQAHNTALG
jgi:hypothetical protein